VNDVVFDSSALLALILHEPGGNLDGLLDRAVISAVNLAEVRTKLIDLEKLEEVSVEADLRALIRVEPFTEQQAVIAAKLRSSTKSFGLSLGDRACIALAIDRGLEVYTSDGKWSKIELGCKVHQIR
jgi:ribonuclease VapC